MPRSLLRGLFTAVIIFAAAFKGSTAKKRSCDAARTQGRDERRRSVRGCDHPAAGGFRGVGGFDHDCFHRCGRACGGQGDRPAQKAEARSSPRVTELEQQLLQVRGESRTTHEEMQTTQEELRSANEELQSTNEEMQSTNE